MVNNFANKLLAKISQQQLVIVVDDFERITNVDTSRAVLGELLENYIHQQGAKVILISSEQNIMDDSNNEGSQQDKGNQNMGVASWFQEVREKYIGRLIRYSPDYEATLKSVANDILERQNDPYALMLDLRTDFSLPCKLIAEEHFLYDSIFTRI